MTTKVWLSTDQELVPGTEIFQSDRRFQLWAYSVSHSQLLLRSNYGADPQGSHHDTTIDLLFKPVTTLKARTGYDGLSIRCATEAEAHELRSAAPGVRFADAERFFLLVSEDETDYVACRSIGWHEDVLGPTRLSFFAAMDRYEPVWPGTTLGGLDAGFTIASLQDLVEALVSERAPAARERWRNVWVVMKKVVHVDGEIEVSGAGVFLTQEDAEDFSAQIRAHIADCWIERLPIAI